MLIKLTRSIILSKDLTVSIQFYSNFLLHTQFGETAHKYLQTYNATNKIYLKLK